MRRHTLLSLCSHATAIFQVRPKLHMHTKVNLLLGRADTRLQPRLARFLPLQRQSRLLARFLPLPSLPSGAINQIGIRTMLCHRSLVKGRRFFASI